MQKTQLKEKLLNTGIIIDNEWLDKYVNIIVDKSIEKHIKFHSQAHHIIPKCYFRFTNRTVDNSASNKVELMFIDHALAHLYLANCTNDMQFKHRNMKAVDHVLGNVNFKTLEAYDIEKELIENSELYQSTYASTREYWSLNCNLRDSSKWSARMWKAVKTNGKKNKGKRYVIKGGVCRTARNEEEFTRLLQDGWVAGNSHKGSVTLHRGSEQTVCVQLSKLDTYFDDYWVRGIRPRGNMIKNWYVIVKDNHREYVSLNYLDDMLQLGWTLERSPDSD